MDRHGAADVITLWELATARADGLALLAHACPDLPPGALASLPLGRQTRALLDLRERCFGPRLPACVACPACGDPLEFELSLPELRLPASPDPPATCLVEQHGERLHMRLPSAADIAAAAAHPGDARLALVARCCLEFTRDGEPCPIDQVSPDTIDAAAAEVAALDPQADLELALACPACGHDFAAAFDILAFLRAELRSRAARLARQVDALARAYGWREADILAMSPARRQLYLDLVGA